MLNSQVGRKIKISAKIVVSNEASIAVHGARRSPFCSLPKVTVKLPALVYVDNFLFNNFLIFLEKMGQC